MNRRQETGAFGEQLAEQMLRLKGYSIVERNWRCPSGEIDLIVQKQREIIFVEVRTTTSIKIVENPLQSIDQKKQLRIKKLAIIFLQKHAIVYDSIRFDVVGIQLAKDGRKWQAEHIIAAF